MWLRDPFDLMQGIFAGITDIGMKWNLPKKKQKYHALKLVFINLFLIFLLIIDDSYPVAIKDEPQTVPNSPPLSPIDLENQELLKLERKRQRNRVAASKCRKRKLERISKLEDKVKHLKGENAELGNMVLCLKEHVAKLKQQVMDHYSAGCTIKLNRL